MPGSSFYTGILVTSYMAQIRKCQSSSLGSNVLVGNGPLSEKIKERKPISGRIDGYD